MSPAQSSGATAVGVRPGGHGKAEPRVGHAVLGEASVDLVAGEARAARRDSPARRQIAACSARAPEPGHPDAVADAEALGAFAHGIDDADDLVPGHQRQLGLAELAVHDVQVGAAERRRPPRAGATAAVPVAGPGGRSA